MEGNGMEWINGISMDGMEWNGMDGINGMEWNQRLLHSPAISLRQTPTKPGIALRQIAGNFNHKNDGDHYGLPAPTSDWQRAHWSHHIVQRKYRRPRPAARRPNSLGGIGRPSPDPLSPSTPGSGDDHLHPACLGGPVTNMIDNARSRRYRRPARSSQQLTHTQNLTQPVTVGGCHSELVPTNFDR